MSNIILQKWTKFNQKLLRGVGVLEGNQIIEFILNNFVKQAERIEIFLHVTVASEISWCNCEKFHGRGIEHGFREILSHQRRARSASSYMNSLIFFLDYVLFVITLYNSELLSDTKYGTLQRNCYFLRERKALLSPCLGNFLIILVGFITLKGG